MFFAEVFSHPALGFLNGVAGLAILFLLIVLYFLPIIIAVNKNHPQTTSITLITLFAGLSIIGWIVALILATSGQRGNREPKRFARRGKSRFKRR